jgi:PAS domain S-box-containing protein
MKLPRRLWRPLGRASLAGIFLLALLEAAEAQPRRVLLLQSYGPHFQPWSIIASQFREELLRQSPYGIDLYEASLQSERFEPSHEQKPFLDYLRALFIEQRPDLVVAMGAPAARLFLQHRALMFPSTPLLITGADERTFNDIGLTSTDTAVASEFDQAKPIEHILQVLPGTTNIAVVIGASPIDKFWTAEYRRALQPLTDRVLFDWFDELSAEEMVTRVAALPPHSAIYYAHVHVDARGVPQEDDRVLSRLHEVASAPIFSWIDSNFGHGIVGGPLLSTQELARRSAAVAIRILGGETPGNVKTPTLALNAPKYDWRELQHWHISEAALPPGSDIYFRGPSAWVQYRVQIVAGLAAFLMQATLICWLLYERRRRRMAEVVARNFISSAGVGIWDWDVRSNALRCTPDLEEIYGLKAGSLRVYSDFRDRVHPDDIENLEAQWDAAIRKRGRFLQEFRVIRPSGETRWVMAGGGVVHDQITGEPIRVLGNNVDITERKRAEEHQKILMAELDHRVKNVLARVAAVARSTRQGSDGIDEFILSFNGRVQSMATAHALLSQTGWRGAHLAAVVRNQVAPYVTDANMTIVGTDVTLTASATQAMAMALHELVTNAVKYGALSIAGGRVLASWDRRPNGGGATNLIFVWHELGGPPMAAAIQSGYGTSLIRKLIPHELGGNVDLVFESGGAYCRIEFPLEL